MFRVLDKSFLKGIIGPYLLSFFIVEFVLLMQLLWKYIDDILGKGYGFFDYFELIAYFCQTVIPMSLPLTVLLSSVMVYGEMAENYELAAFKSAGVSLWRMLLPGLVVAGITMLFSFYASNYLKPKAYGNYYKKLRDMKTNQLTFAFDENIFSQDFNNYSIHVRKKSDDGITVEDILIYDHSDLDKSVVNMIQAQKARLTTSRDKKYLFMDLQNGYTLKEVRAEGANMMDKSFNVKARPVNRVYFKKMHKTFVLSDLLKLTSTRIDHKKYEILNVWELDRAIDSLENNLLETRKEGVYNFNELMTVSHDDSVTDIPEDNVPKDIPSVKRPKLNRSRLPLSDSLLFSLGTMKILKDFDPSEVTSIYEVIGEDKKQRILDKVIRSMESTEDKIDHRYNDVRIRKIIIGRYLFKQHEQFSRALICLIFLFIGAPAGAIVRKGGFGLPLLIAIIFYITFIMSGILGEKMVSVGKLSGWQAAWMPCVILMPFALLFSYLAVHDKNLTNWSASNVVKSLLFWRRYNS